MAADGFPPSVTGLSKRQLYDIMARMKTLIEYNEEQAKDILMQNPALTKALFQAQVMLEMVQSPQTTSNTSPTSSLNPQPPAPSAQQSGRSLRDQSRRPVQSQPVVPGSSASDLQSPSLPSHALPTAQQPKGHASAHSTPMSLPQSSQLPTATSHQHYSSLQPSLHLQPPLSSPSTQLQQPIQTTATPNLPLQLPLPPQNRLSAPSFHHQVHPQMGPGAGFQQSGAGQPHHAQPVFHSGAKPSPTVGPSFASQLQAQPTVPSQPSQPLYQVGGSRSNEYNPAGITTQADRGPAWPPGLPDNAAGMQLPGPPPLPGQMVPTNQSARAAPLTPEMEKALLQQVMSLTPEQVNMLPPDQRNQVLQLQQMLRQ